MSGAASPPTTGSPHVASWLVDLPAHVKVLSGLLYVVAAVATPREAIWAFAVHGGLVATVAVLGEVPLRWLARRLVIELPFVAFALLLPFVGRGPTMALGPLTLSTTGLWSAWNILAKATLGVAVSGLLVASTPVADLLAGLERLRLPAALVMIASFMVRYGHVLAGESERMRVARLSRGHDPRWFWQAKATATSAGALFVRAYERGERVHLAMQARGFDGSFPRTDHRPAGWSTVAGLAFPIVGTAVAIAAWLGR